jgi:hypothetical protein
MPSLISEIRKRIMKHILIPKERTRHPFILWEAAIISTTTKRCSVSGSYEPAVKVFPY